MRHARPQLARPRLTWLLPLPLLCGCGATPTVSCVGGVYLFPVSTTADHAATAPGNQVQFYRGFYSAQGSCPIPQIVGPGPVTLSDTVNASATAEGLVTCLNATTQPVIVTPAGTTGPTQGAALTCR